MQPRERSRAGRDDRDGRGSWRGVIGKLVLACTLSLALLGCGRVAERSASVELHACGAGATQAKCAVVQVFEDREAGEGRTIDLAVTVVPAKSREPAPDPVFLLVGGPGQGAASVAYFVAPMLEPILRERDVVFVDLRGTGTSTPLACEIEDPERLDELLSGELELDKLEGCLASYESDLRHYTTETMMADLEQVRAALGYEQINLFGVSHGTRASLAYLRAHPERVRSLVLDGVAPLDVPVYHQSAAAAERVLDRLLANCRADSACSAAFPGLERELEQVLTGLETNRRLIEVAHPRTGEVQRVNLTPTGFLGVIRGALYSGEFAALVPLAIHAAHGGDFGPIAALAVRVNSFSKSISFGAYLTIACAEELGEFDAAKRREASAGLRWFDNEGLAELHEACLRWPDPELPESFDDPIESDVPALLLSGRHDPITPPELGDHVAEQLRNSRHVVIESVNHGVWWRGCTPELVASFFADPQPEAVDPSCYDELARPRFFVGPNGPRARAAQHTPDRIDPVSPSGTEKASPGAARGPALAHQQETRR